MDKLNLIALCIVVLLGIIGVSAYLQTRPEKSAPLPKFSFDQSKASGWWGRDSINVQEVAHTTNYTGNEPIEKLPVADTTIFHGTTEQAAADGCFVTFSYYNYPIADLGTAYREYESRKTAQGTLEILQPSQQVAKTFEGNKIYELRQYSYTIEGKDTLSGYEIGFIELASGSIRVEGVCKTAKDLVLTQPILNSVTLNKV